MTNEEAKQWIEDLITTMRAETSGPFPDVAYKDEVYVALEMAIKALEQTDAIETIRAEISDLKGTFPSEWIPVSERLPEKGEEVIVSRHYRFFDQYEDEYDTTALIYMGKDEIGHYFTTRLGGCYRNIIAWMPLPPPYRKEQT